MISSQVEDARVIFSFPLWFALLMHSVTAWKWNYLCLQFNNVLYLLLRQNKNEDVKVGKRFPYFIGCSGFKLISSTSLILLIPA